jgi:hypothetical protein
MRLVSTHKNGSDEVRNLLQENVALDVTAHTEHFARLFFDRRFVFPIHMKALSTILLYTKANNIIASREEHITLLAIYVT